MSSTPQDLEDSRSSSTDTSEDVNPDCEPMVLRGKFCNFTCKILVDSGASGIRGNFISRQFLESIGVQPDQDSDTTVVRFADGRHNSTTKTVTRRLHIGKYSETLRLTVTDLPDYDIVLGVPWWKSHSPHLDFNKMLVTFSHKGHLFTVPGLTSEQASEHFTRVQIVTAKQFARGAPGYEYSALLLIRSVEDLDDLDNRVGVELQDSDLPSDISAEIKRLIKKYPKAFPKRLPKGLPRHTFRHKINLVPGATPQFRQSYKLSEPELRELRAQLTDLLEKHFVQPSASPWGAPVLFAKKSGGGLRLCIDYRALNKLTIKNRYPLPRIDELLDRLKGAKYFTKLDLASGFWQIPMAPEDIPKTAFNTRYGQFEFTVMPFGLCNAPSTFQAMMNQVLFDYLDDFVLIYLDDVLIFSTTYEEHLQHLEKVFKRLEEQDLYCKPHKCDFAKTTIKYLGHIVSNGTVSVDPSKISAITDWPVPTTLVQLQSFLGHLNYFRRFIKNFARHAKPLTDLLKKDTFTNKESTIPWSQECQIAFDILKRKLTSAPVLHIFDHDKPTQVITDASDFAIGGVLLQDFNNGWQPVAFESRKLKPPEVNYSVYDRELLALVHCCKVWRSYLLGRHVTCVTDHATVQHFNTQPCLTSPRRVRWSEYLQDFDIDIVYRPGRVNPADPLSRRPDHQAALQALQAISTLELSHDMLEQVKQGYKDDPYYCTSDNLREFEFDANTGLYFLRGRLCIPDIPELKTQLIREHHDVPFSAHPGVRRTLQLVAKHYFWPFLARDVQAYVLTCNRCQVNKVQNQKPKGLLQPLPVPTRRWSDISLDLITHLPQVPSTGNDSIFVIVDRLSKMVHFVPTKHTVTATELAHLFIKEIFRLHGVPQTIVSDRDPKFTSEFWTTVFNRLGTKLAMSTAYHPQTDGQTERTNRTLEEMLRHYCGDPAHPSHQSQWEDLLPLVEFAYNSTPQTSTSKSPFFLNYGQDPLTPATVSIANVSPTLQVPPEQEWLVNLNQCLNEARDSIRHATASQAFQADQHRRPYTFAPGDKVYIEAKALPRRKRGSKISSLRRGPYKIVQAIGPSAYKVKIPGTWQIHDVFHVSQLTPVRKSTRGRIPERIVQFDPSRKMSFLVVFQDGSDYDASWISRKQLQDTNPRLLASFLRSLAQNPLQFFHS